MSDEEYTLSERVIFSNPDITWMVRKGEWDYRFIGKMIGWFGEQVVVEALRRASYDLTPKRVFVGICRNVEKEDR